MAASDDKLDLTVLYLHGLESGVMGTKSKRLASVAREVHGEQMPVKALRKPFSTNPWMTAAVVTGVASIVTIVIGLCVLALANVPGESGWNTWQQLGAAVALVALGGVGISLILLQRAIQFLVEACYDVQREAVHTHKPDIVVASSFGGAMAQMLLARGEWAGPTLLLAPAGTLVANYYELATSVCCCVLCRLTPCCKARAAEGQLLVRQEDDDDDNVPAMMVPARVAVSTAGRPGTPCPPGADVPVLVVHACGDATVPFGDTLDWVEARPEWMQCQVLPTNHDGHALRKVASPENLRVWLQGVWGAWMNGTTLEVPSIASAQ